MKFKKATLTDNPIDSETFERFFELSPDLLCIASTDGRFLRLNRQWSEVLGYELSQLEGEEFLQFVHPEDVGPTIEALSDLSRNRVITNFVNRYRCKDGSYRWIEWRSQPAGGRIYAAARDISDHLEVQRELKASVEQQKLVATVARIFATGDDLDSQVSQALATIGRQIGASRVYVFLDSEGGQETSNTHEWCSEGIASQKGDLQNVPYEIIPSWRPLLTTEGRIDTTDISALPPDIRAVLEPQDIVAIIVEPLYIYGALKGFVGFDECTGTRAWSDAERRLLSTISGIISNAFERGFGTQRLQESENKLRRILEGTNAGTWEWNIQTGETVFNERWAEIVGYTLAELSPTTIETWSSLTHPDDLGRSERLLAKHLAGDIDQYECEVRMRHKEGHWVWVSDRGRLIQRDDEGRPHTMFGTHIDITDRREALNRLEYNKRLLDLFFKQSLDGFFFMILDEPVEWNDGVDKEAVLDYVFKHQRITRINQAMLDQYRAKESDFVGLTPADLFGHDIPQGRKVWRQFFDQGHLHIDTQEQRFDGEAMIVEGDYICMYDEQGRITGHFGVQRDVTEARGNQEALEQSENRFRELAIRDGLTGVFNRRYLIERLAGELSKAQRTGNPFSVAIVDIDHFKQINDAEGHLAGDFVLQEFAKTLSAELRTYDVVGRYGGEEFLMIFDSIHRDIVAQRLEAVLERLAASPYIYEGKEIAVSFSGGVADTAEFSNETPSWESLLSKADSRLYQAKSNGRRRICW